MKKYKYVLTLASLLCLASPCFAQATYSGDTLERKVERLEKDLRMLNKEVYQNGVSPLSDSSKTGLSKGQTADFEVRLSSLEANIRQMKGEVETINYNQSQLATTVGKLQKDIDFRFNNMGATTATKKKFDLSAFQKQSGDSKSTKAPLSVVKNDDDEISPEKQYKIAFNFLKEKEFAKAEKDFAKLIKKHPKHKLAGNAQYWLAETYYVRGDMEEAMKQFAYGYKHYKGSSKATDNLLKLGITLGALDRKDDACLTLAELETNYVPLSKTISNRLKNEKKKLDCGE